VDGVEPPVPGLTPGRKIELPRRGITWARDLPGPSPTAPTVLLLHGWTATADLNWVTSYQALQRRYRVVALDHRGHGRGIRSLRPFRLEDCADDAAALCRALGIDRAIVCGYSMGGPIAQLTWRRHRDLVSGLVLCATARRFGNGDPRMRAMGAGLLGVSVAAKVASPALRNQLVSRYVSARIGDDPRLQWAAEQIRRHDPATLIQAGAALMGYDATPWIGGVDVPTSVVVTAADNVVPAHRQRALAASIPGARTFECRGTHAVVIENPNAFVPKLLDAVNAAAAIPVR
jgi:3-oxoadipate enol-lactonase